MWTGQFARFHIRIRLTKQVAVLQRPANPHAHEEDPRPPPPVRKSWSAIQLQRQPGRPAVQRLPVQGETDRYRTP